MVPSAAVVAGRLGEARVVDAVAGDQGALPARRRQLLTQQAGVLVVAAVEDRGRAAGDLIFWTVAEKSVCLPSAPGLVRADHGRAERALHHVGQARAVRRLVVDDEDLLAFSTFLM